MPAASNGGEDRTAQTGAAVTRPAASVNGTVTTGSRCGQPAARSAARHAPSACAAGTSLTNGLLLTMGLRYSSAVPGRPHSLGRSAPVAVITERWPTWSASRAAQAELVCGQGGPQVSIGDMAGMDGQRGRDVPVWPDQVEPSRLQS